MYSCFHRSVCVCRREMFCIDNWIACFLSKVFFNFTISYRIACFFFFFYLHVRARTHGDLHKFYVFVWRWDPEFRCDGFGRPHFWGSTQQFSILSSSYIWLLNLLSFTAIYLLTSGFCLCLESLWFTSCVWVGIWAQYSLFQVPIYEFRVFLSGTEVILPMPCFNYMSLN